MTNRLRQHDLRTIIAERGQLDALGELYAGVLAESSEKSSEEVCGPVSIGL